MVISACNHEQTKKFGKDKRGNQRYRCLVCGKIMIDRSNRPLGDMRIPKDKAVMALRMMLEGSSLRTINRLTGLNLHTIASLLLLVGERCQRFWKAKMTNIQTNDVQCDELWSFVGCKEKARPYSKAPEAFGDSYTFLGIDRDTKLVLAYHIGKRGQGDYLFTRKLRHAIQGNCQITTDGFTPYRDTIPSALWDKNITFAQLIKVFGKQTPREEARYSPAPITNIIKKRIWGEADESRISTSHIERWNLSLRMGLRRFTRLTNAHSKSFRYHSAAITMWLCFYNFCRVHSTLKTTPAVKACLTDSAWTVEQLLDEVATF
jgi:transposase-like protein/IS1 family transposase